ncbi:50S ribosomal protein L15 [Lacihabitans sp. LS3-19]|nr:50S ribosomal protein L15 [Lacihabitans sp. LS3-19]
MKLEILKPAEGSVRNNTRQGRGQGSGGGGTARRGHKGAKSRSGYSAKRGFEGGQMPLQRRVPKFGFNNINRIEYKAINLDTIQSLVEKTGVKLINLAFLKEHGLMSKTDLIKVLGRGELTSKVDVSVNAFSKSAISIIENLGGKATVVSKGSASSSISNEVVEVVTDVVAAPKAKKTKVGDDLTKIEGIGPKISELLVAGGIETFLKLSETSAEEVQEILNNAGGNFASHNPATWAEQAKLAADGNWDELKVLQDKLNGGRPE